MNQLIEIYKRKIRPKAKEELAYFINMDSLNQCIYCAAYAINRSGKRYSHQRRLSESVLQESYQILLKEKDRISQTKSFEELHSMIRGLLIDIHGIGPLYIYDTSLRLGGYLGLSPEKVYLHAGTKDGAKALGLNWRSDYLELKELPPSLLVLDPHEIEDFLCIFKDELAGAKYRSDTNHYFKKSGCC